MVESIGVPSPSVALYLGLTSPKNGPPLYHSIYEILWIDADQIRQGPRMGDATQQSKRSSADQANGLVARQRYKEFDALLCLLVGPRLS